MTKTTEQQSATTGGPPRDDDVGDIFRTMRQALGLSPSAIAAKLETPTATITALETGTLANLPEWQETSRIVTAYAGLLDLDCRPILRRIAISKAVEVAGDGVEPTKANGSGNLEAWQVGGFIAGFVVIFALVFAIAYTRTGAPRNAGQSIEERSSARPATPQSPQAPSGPVTVRRIPLPQAIEGPSGKQTVDPGSGDSDKTSVSRP